MFKKSFTSFGKLILSDEKNMPIYSIGNARKFANSGDSATLPKETPGPIYSPASEQKYKYKSVH